MLIYYVCIPILNEPKSGVLVEVVNHTVDFMERVLEDVLENHHPDELKQNLIAGLLHGVPLAGERQLNKWKERGAKYPLN